MPKEREGKRENCVHSPGSKVQTEKRNQNQRKEEKSLEIRGSLELKQFLAI